jgi:hypothetical protein
MILWVAAGGKCIGGTIGAFHCALNIEVPGDLDAGGSALIYMTNDWSGYGDWGPPQ